MTGVGVRKSNQELELTYHRRLAALIRIEEEHLSLN